MKKTYDPHLILTPRLRLVSFTEETLQQLQSGVTLLRLERVEFRIDTSCCETDPGLPLIARLQGPLFQQPGARRWLARAWVDSAGRRIGHGGFHHLPAPIEQLRCDPSFKGSVDQANGLFTEIGYTVFPEYRRQGFASEAAAALVRWAFGCEGPGAIIATTNAENVSSQRVLAHAGPFRRIGVLRVIDGSQIPLRDRPSLTGRRGRERGSRTAGP